MKIKLTGKVLSFLFLGAVMSCQAEYLPSGSHESQPVKVGIFAGGVYSRTSMQEDGLSTAWTAGDNISLWAINQSGTHTLSNQRFTTYGIDQAHGYFTSELASAMPDGTYTYYVCYPTPTSVTGTNATFYLSGTQDGKVSGGNDIMIADPVSHGPLTSLSDENNTPMRVEMNRMMHQFRFYVPSEDTKLNGEAIERIVLTFPTPVIGNVQLDLSNPSKSAILLSGYRDINLNLKEPLTREDQNFACVAFVPTRFSAGQALKIKAYTDDMIVELDPIDLCAKNCLAGHSTPVKLNIKALKEYPWQLTVRLSANNLGEKVNSITFQAPGGCVWPNSSSNVYTYNPGRKINVGDEFVFRFEDEAQYRAFSKQSIAITYDSDNAITYQNVTVPDLSANDKASVSLTVPYLFYQNFSGIPNFNDGHDNPKVGTGSDTYKGITELSSYTSALAGWYGTRIGGQSGTAVRICCRYEHVIAAGAYYKGRLYSPFLSNIKEGSDVKISVSFKYGGDRNERDPLFGSPPKKSPIMYFGINTQDPVTNPDYQEGNILDSVTGLIGGSGYASNAVSSLSPMAIKGESIQATGGSYTSFAGTKTVTIENVDRDMRLAWIISTDNTSSNTNANYWLYIDDIIVKIVQ